MRDPGMPNLRGRVALPSGRRPTSVLVLSILGIMWGGLMLGLAAVSMIALLNLPHEADPMAQALAAVPWYRELAMFASAGELLLNALLVGASFSAVRLRPLARRTLLLYAVGALLMLSYSTIVQALLATPVVEPFYAQRLQAVHQPELVHLALNLAAGVGVLLRAALPAAILIIYNRKNVMAAFRDPQ